MSQDESQNQKTSMERCKDVSRMDDHWLAKITKNNKKHLQATWATSFANAKTSKRKLDINIIGEEAHWMKYRT